VEDYKSPYNIQGPSLTTCGIICKKKKKNRLDYAMDYLEALRSTNNYIDYLWSHIKNGQWKWVKAHYLGRRGGGAKMLSHCNVFQGCPCLNFSHDNIGAYFSKLFA